MTELQKEYFTEKEIAEDILETLENYEGLYCELHHEVFNTDYHIIGTYKAKEALESYGVFKAIDEVQTYEKDNFGENYTDVSNPEELANMLYYLKGYEFMYDILDFDGILEEAIKDLEIEEFDLWNSEATPEVNAYISRKITAFMEDK